VWYKGDWRYIPLDTKKNRQRAKYNRLTQLEGRIDYLEGVIYQLFQLTEKLFKTVERFDDDETPEGVLDAAKGQRGSFSWGRGRKRREESLILEEKPGTGELLCAYGFEEAVVIHPVLLFLVA
jgi:hypothetical protein